MSSKRHYRFAGMVGNILEHYDHALFGFLAPFLAPLFFNNQDPLTALILTYAILPLGILTRPIGSLFFGWVGDCFGRRQALFFSLSGMAVVTAGMGFLPIFSEVGSWAPLYLAIAKMLQNFFAAGESTGGAIFVLENTETAKRSLFSSLFDACSIVGILIASALVTFFSHQGYMEEGWRILFWLGGATAILGVILRLKAREGKEFIVSHGEKRMSLLKMLSEHKKPLLLISLAYGFSYTTYSLPFNLMNGYIPLVTKLTKTDVMKDNTTLLIIDMLLLPCFGYLANRWGKEKVMLAGSLGSIVCAGPLFYFLTQGTLEMVFTVRLSIVMLGAAFAAPYHAWAIERVAPQYRFTVLSLAGALGSQLIGAPTAAICLWLYQKLGWVSSPSLYLIVVAALATYAVRSLKPEASQEPSIIQ
jgi:MHS family proline/betaine transporter-like MFS transporter